jgi:outer membrane protein assembly factor BamB
MKYGIAIVIWAAAVFYTTAADWPQWRGPTRMGMSSENLNSNWAVEGPPVLWRASVGIGFSSIAISRGRAYTMGNSEQRETVWCFDARSGREIWKHTYPSPLGAVYHEGGPVSTPTVESNRVFTISKWGDVFCLNATNGAVIWEHDLRRDGVISNRWGFAGSPLLWRNLVILNAGGMGSALDRDSGRVVWLNGTKPTGYASPTVYRSRGKECILIFAAKYLEAVSPHNGHELWRFPWETAWDTNNPDPLIYHDEIFISSFSRGCALLRIRNDVPEVVYDKKTLYNNLSSGIVLGDYLYAFSGEAKKNTDFRCLYLPTGEVKWTRKDPAFGSLLCAEGKLLVLSEKGELILGQASPAEFKVLARAQVLGGLCWTPPALADGLVYARNATGDLVCCDLSVTQSGVNGQVQARP